MISTLRALLDDVDIPPGNRFVIQEVRRKIASEGVRRLILSYAMPLGPLSMGEHYPMEPVAPFDNVFRCTKACILIVEPLVETVHRMYGGPKRVLWLLGEFQTSAFQNQLAESHTCRCLFCDWGKLACFPADYTWYFCTIMKPELLRPDNLRKSDIRCIVVVDQCPTLRHAVRGLVTSGDFDGPVLDFYHYYPSIFPESKFQDNPSWGIDRLQLFVLAVCGLWIAVMLPSIASHLKFFLLSPSILDWN
jgi:hypothetical protein